MTIEEFRALIEAWKASALISGVGDGDTYVLRWVRGHIAIESVEGFFTAGDDEASILSAFAEIERISSNAESPTIETFP